MKYLSSQKITYVSISIPEELIERVRQVMVKKRLGYRTVSEFVIEAVRRRIEELEKQEVVSSA